MSLFLLQENVISWVNKGHVHVHIFEQLKITARLTRGFNVTVPTKCNCCRRLYFTLF